MAILSIVFSLVGIFFSYINYRSTQSRDNLNLKRVRRDILIERKNKLMDLHNRITQAYGEYYDPNNPEWLYSNSYYRIRHIMDEAPVEYLSKMNLSKKDFSTEEFNNIPLAYKAAIEDTANEIEDLNSFLLGSNYQQEKEDIDSIMEQEMKKIRQEAREKSPFNIHTKTKEMK